jgi:hypothetical protein
VQGDFVVLVSESHCLCGVDVAAPQQLRRGAHSLAEVVELMQPQLTPHEVRHATRAPAAGLVATASTASCATPQTAC